MTVRFQQTDDLLADLQAMRAALESRKEALTATLSGPYNPAETAKLQKEVLALRELIMTIGQALWNDSRGRDADRDPAPVRR